MSEIERKLPSGAIVVVTVAPFADAKAFQDEVIRTVGSRDIGSMELSAVAALIASSSAVEAAFFKCGARAMYKPDGTDENRMKVSPAMFDDPKFGNQARAEYYDIFMAVAEANIKPFMQALFSKLGIRLPAGIFGTQP